MKANKALKRLTRIATLMSDVTERYSPTEPALREALRDAASAVTRAKEAVGEQASSGTPKKAAVKRETTPKKPAKRAVAKQASAGSAA